jgi:DNA modification methylase
LSWEVRQGDALQALRSLRGLQADAIVTSPPYADQRRGWGARPERYGEWLEPFLVELLHAGAPHCSFMLNIGRVMRNGEEQDCAGEARRLAQRAGWKWVDTIVWHKPNSLPWSSCGYMHSAHEYVWWLAASVDAYRGFTAETRTPHARSSVERAETGKVRPGYRSKNPRYRKEGKKRFGLHPDGARPKTIFTAPVGQVRGLLHPAPMPLALARFLVALACRPGGVVLDPFCGSGTTGIAALATGRRFVGIERDAAYADEARRRIAAGPLFADQEATR